MMNIKKIVMGLMVVATTCLFVGCGKPTVNLNDYIECEFIGYDGYGKVQWDFAEGMFDDVDMEFNMDSEDIEFYGEDYLKELVVDELIYELDGDFDVSEHLSNGDKIEFEWDIKDSLLEAVEENLGIKIKYSSFSTTVSDLKDPSEFDIWEYIEVEPYGYAPNGKIKLSTSLNGLSISADKEENLSNGDQINIKLEPTYLDKNFEDICDENDIPVFDNEIPYTVEGLAAYVTKLSDIPDKAYEIMKSEAEKKLESIKEDEDACGTGFFFTPTHKNFVSYELDKVGVYNTDNGNRVYFVYKVDYDCHGNVSLYIPIYFSDIVDSVEGKTENDFHVNGYEDFYYVSDDNKKYLGDIDYEEIITDINAFKSEKVEIYFEDKI